MKNNQQIRFFIVIICMAALLSGCATGLPPSKSNMTSAKEDQSLPSPSADTAVIVFLSAVFISDAVYDVTSGDPKVIGKVSTGNKTVYEVPAGQHYFSTLSKGSYLAVNASGGKTYFVLVQQSTVAASAGLAMSVFVSSAAGTAPGPGLLIPVRNGGEGPYQYSSDFIQDRINDDELVEITDEAEQYYSQDFFKKAATANRSRYFTDAEANGKKFISQFTLNPDDGV